MPRELSVWTSPSQETYDSRALTDRPRSVADLFRRRVAESAGRVGFMYPTTDAEGTDTWHQVTWTGAKDRVYALAAGLLSLGLQPQERVAIASSTRWEWALADLAVMCAGGATTTIYPTTIPSDVGFILADSQSSIVFAENAEQVEKIRLMRDEAPGVRTIVVMDGEGDGDWVITLADLAERGRAALAQQPRLVDEQIDQIEPDALATLIYTSGTTGRPKGVRLLQKTWTYQAVSNGLIDTLHEDDLQYLWLPLSHVFGKQLLTINLGIGFATAIDGRIDKIVPNLAVVRPTFMGAAPRIFEKAYAGVNAMMATESNAKQKLFAGAVALGLEAAELAAQGKKPGPALAAKLALADKLVLSKVRERFGGRVRFFVSGSAALNQDIARWFYAVGMPIAEGYGLTESSSAACVNRLKAYKVGSVGWPIPGLEVKIADDGEVLLRGEGIMDGYHNNAEATAEVVNDEGWFHTGDIGNVDERGFLSITDRKKDLFKTSGGKYVAPSAIESTFKGLCPLVSQLLVHGNGRNFVSALVTLDPDAVKVWAGSHGMADQSYAQIVGSPQMRETMQGYIDQLNSGLNRWETIKKFTILDHDLSVENGELTPSLKLKRRVVTDRFADLIEAHYAD